MKATITITRLIPDYDLRRVSWLDGTLTNLVKGYRLREGEALVLTGRKHDRLRIVVRLGGRAVLLIPETHRTTLETLATWVATTFRGGTATLAEYSEQRDAA